MGTISGLEGAAAASGGSVEGMASTIAGLQSAAQQFAITGQGATIPYLRALGVQLHRTADGAVDVKDELLQIAAGSRNLGAAQATELYKGAGVGDEGTINLLLQYRNDLPGLAKLLKDVQAAGTPSPADIAAANERNKAFVLFDRAITTLGRNILTFLTPALTGFLNLITKLSESPLGKAILTGVILALSAAVGLLSLSLTALAASTLWTGLASGFGLISTAIGLLATVAIPAIIDAFVAFGAVLLATPVGWILAAIAALGVGAYELITHWSPVKTFFKGLWDDVAGYFQAGVQKIEKIPAVRWALRKLGIAAPEAGGSAPSKSSPSGAGKSASASDRAINTVLQNEDRGLTGKVTSDSGGITKFGISSKAHPGLDVANLSLADAKRIYKAEYWDPIGGDSLPAALQATALDAAINQGVGNAKAWLKASGGDPIKFNALRRGQYEHLAASNPEKYGKYLKGWEARVPSATQTALATASAGSSTASLPRLGAGASVLAANPPSTSVTNNSSEVSMGNVIINTKATDAKGIAASIKPMLRSSVLVAQTQSGVS